MLFCLWQAAAASVQQQMDQVALLPRMMAMAHVLAANDAQQRQALYAPPAPQPGMLPECAPLVTEDAQVTLQQQQQQQQQKQQCAEQLMALLAAGKPAEGVRACSCYGVRCIPVRVVLTWLLDTAHAQGAGSHLTVCISQATRMARRVTSARMP